MRLATPRAPDSRLRAYAQFLAALFYYFLARVLARRGAMGLSSEQWRPLVEQAMLVFLLLLGFAGIGYALNRQLNPISAQGLPRRPGWTRELAMGLAMGLAPCGARPRLSVYDDADGRHFRGAVLRRLRPGLLGVVARRAGRA